MMENERLHREKIFDLVHGMFHLDVYNKNQLLDQHHNHLSKDVQHIKYHTQEKLMIDQYFFPLVLVQNMIHLYEQQNHPNVLMLNKNYDYHLKFVKVQLLHLLIHLFLNKQMDYFHM